MESENIKSSKVLAWIIPVVGALIMLQLSDLRDGIKDSKNEIKEARQEFTSETKAIRGKVTELSIDVEAIKYRVNNSSITTKEPSTYYAQFKDEKGKVQRILLKDTTFSPEGKAD
ncbi:hypothetical protein VCRA2123O443_220043 [Vibrio crassostreae]|uniref:hypothetical protein n=1 Tax=Vibrio crassostreae TaxID=246167 RepID=UPI001B301255|nr:hypothetical protein [Vibrio crassostreae]CAK1924110.1 hypothetical protein VCRA2110O182_220012 [Vibrio crassostreae]CAK2309175.1 hypothetical protein VCRA2111O408_220014 [Vibrio crassostreae]CAK2326601.1 hypothetical protein VCRA211O406_220042 [Vibrio crassostreae]CAK3241206.1 hypothetical protein VCRA2123O443_220043 [Vibrio crassostreae]